MQKLKFVKMSGVGNDFIFFNEGEEDFKERWQARFASKTRGEVAQELCRRGLSIGADGLVFVKRLSEADIEWDFYNADGTTPNMCGNAARCAALYASELFKCSSPLSLHTKAGEVKAEIVKHKDVIVSMPRVTELRREQAMTVGKKSYSYAICDTGVPHAVVEVDNLDSVNLENLKPFIERLRFPEGMSEEGANVTFVQAKQSYIKAVTFERGVEDFTQACGTGAVAARWKMRQRFSMKNDLKIQMPGGVLIVELVEKPPYWEAKLSGQTHFVFTGVFI